jgi:hypothetical protein
MNPIDCFRKWAGDHPWSSWTKATLFDPKAMLSLQSDRDQATTLLEEAEKTIAGTALADLRPSSAGGRTCIVIDQPVEISVALGAAMSRRGFAPVPLFNGAYAREAPLVTTHAIVQALVDLADRVMFKAEAPPAFLLDSNRRQGVPEPGRFDNRWIVFPQDFPSGGRLIAAGIRECAVLAERSVVQDDLSHVLCRFEDAGMEIQDVGGVAKTPARMLAPRWYRSTFYRNAALSRLRPNPYGGFGAVVPDRRQDTGPD